MGRDWIVNTLLDLDATDGEVVAAARAATPAEMAAARRELEHRLFLAELRQHTIEGRQVREQHPELLSS